MWSLESSLSHTTLCLGEPSILLIHKSADSHCCAVRSSPQGIHPNHCRWAFEWLPVWAHYKWCCHEPFRALWGTHVCTSVWHTPEVVGCTQVQRWQTLLTSFQSGCTHVHSHWWCVQVLGCSISSPVLGIARLSHSSHPGRWRGIVVSIWVALMTNVGECLSHVYWPFEYPFWERDCSCPLSGKVDCRPSRLTESLTLPPKRRPSWSHRGRALLAHHDLLRGSFGGQQTRLCILILPLTSGVTVLGSPMGKTAVIYRPQRELRKSIPVCKSPNTQVFRK